MIRTKSAGKQITGKKRNNILPRCLQDVNVDDDDVRRVRVNAFVRVSGVRPSSVYRLTVVLLKLIQILNR